MNVRCPHCHSVFEPRPERNAQVCPACSKTVLLPRFFGADSRRGAADNPALLYREAMLRRRAGLVGGPAPGALPLLKRPMRAILVVALLVIVGGALLRQARDPRELAESARVEQAVRNLTTLRIAIELFHRDCGRYPTTAEGLAALLRDPGADGWNGPYIHHLRPDPWQRQFQYYLHEGEPRLLSFGADGHPGTEDDLWAPLQLALETLSDEGVYPVR